MTEDIVEIIARYGLETILIAVTVNILTALIKLPIKYLAGKTKNSARITRFIVVLPLIIGFGATVCYMKLVTGNIIFGRAFITLWLTSSSLSPAQETESSPSAQTESVKKIVLRGNGYVQTDVKE